MKKFTLLTFLAAGLANAQALSNVAGVTLSGPLTDLTLENHSGRQVTAALLIYEFANKTTQVHFRLFTNSANQMPDGGSERVNTFSKSQLELDAAPNRRGRAITGKLLAVIFADGEFRGEDSHGFRADIEQRLQSMRQVWQMAKAGDWKAVQAKADEGVRAGLAGLTAERMLSDRALHGDADAVKSFEYVGNFPAITWKDNLLNKLEYKLGSPNIPNIFQAFAQWIMPTTVHAQTIPYSNPQPYPQDATTDAWHVNEWTYGCSTWPFSSYPCPGVLNNTPWEGIDAYCSDSGGYYIAVQTYFSVNYTGYMRGTMVATSKSPSAYTLAVNGQCRTQPGTDHIEYFEYDKSCTGPGPSNATPVLVNDSTGYVCGAGFLGFPQ